MLCRLRLAVLQFGLTAVLLCMPGWAQQGTKTFSQPQGPAFWQSPPKDELLSKLRGLPERLPDTRVPAKGLVPPDSTEGLLPQKRAERGRRPRSRPVEFHWAAAGHQHLPLYFEDAMLERHGQSRAPFVQPLVSGARFFMTIPALPYAAMVDAPCRPVATLGHYRVGSGAPYLLQRPPLQVDAGLLEAGLATGLIFIVP